MNDDDDVIVGFAAQCGIFFCAFVGFLQRLLWRRCKTSWGNCPDIKNSCGCSFLPSFALTMGEHSHIPAAEPLLPENHAPCGAFESSHLHALSDDLL